MNAQISKDPLTLTTIYHAYNFDTSTADGKAGWLALKAKLASYPQIMHSHGGDPHYQPKYDNIMIRLDTSHLFDNQWNSSIGRVFDWALDARYTPTGARSPLRTGHYLEQTAEMREIRRNTHACGYCGKQAPAAKGYVFCPHCLDSEYLKASDLYMTRMRAIDENSIRKYRPPLTEAESAYLLPLYRDAQLRGSTARGKARITKARADVLSKAAKALAAAAAERDGMLWLMDRGINTDNVIYYSHTTRFSFGWRHPVDGEILSQLLDIISEFPFPYDIKTADGRTLSGG